jgi:predicted RNA-binding Zn-ribbon protein involved in translation (DUF1610 family)
MTCDKVTFATYKGARKHANTVSASPNTKVNLVPYKCPNCGAFHVTTRPTPKKLHPNDDPKYKVSVGEYLSTYEFTKKLVKSINKKLSKRKKG